MPSKVQNRGVPILFDVRPLFGILGYIKPNGNISHKRQSVVIICYFGNKKPDNADLAYIIEFYYIVT